MTKLEEVARAICEAIPFGVDQADAAKAARAAIEALREPTEAMIEAGLETDRTDWREPGEGLDISNLEKAWAAMIDAILNTKGE